MVRVMRCLGGLCAFAAALALTGYSFAAAAAVPEGPRLALQRWGLFAEGATLLSIDASGRRPIVLARGELSNGRRPLKYETPSWSPDGARIAFTGTGPGLAGLQNRRVYVTGTDGRGPRLVPGTRGAYEPLFTLDGGSVVFGRAWRRGMSVWLADLEGGSTRRLTAARRGHHLAPSSFSPDGSKLLVDRYIARRGEGVAAVDLNTGAVEGVLRRGREPVFSPDGTRFAFTRWGRIRRRDGSRTISTDVFVARTDGSGAKRLTKTRFQDEFSPTWDPSGERLAFVRNLSEHAEEDPSIELSYGAAVMQMNADGTCQQVLVKPTFAAHFGTAWQPGPGREAGRIYC